MLFLIIKQKSKEKKLEKIMTFHNFIILIKSAFDKDKNNYQYNIFFEKASHELPKNKFLYKIQMLYHDRLTFLKELILIRQANQKSAIFFTIGNFYIKGLSFSHMYATDAINDLLMMSMNVRDIAILNIKGAH